MGSGTISGQVRRVNKCTVSEDVGRFVNYKSHNGNKNFALSLVFEAVHANYCF